ncbi:MAG: LamG domain-containing protein, partial [Chloroflexi bacterium]|nr:LamG domain-containing protein [Chloroflexota bacterium]
MAFDGYGDDVLIGWAQSIGPLSGRSAWTFEAWVNPSDLTGPRTIYSEQDASGADTLVIRLRRDAQPQVLEVGLRRSGTLTWFGVEAPADIVTGTWTHVAVTFEAGSRLQLAINGTVRLADTNGANGRLAAPDLAIASTLARAGDGSPGYAGAIDEVRLWSVARAYDASNAVYLQKLAGGEPNLLVHYPVSAYASTDARGATLADQSGNGISGTLRGGVRWIPSRAPVDRPATPHSIGLSAATDTGASATDGITKLNAVTVTGRASAGSTVALFDGSGTTAIATGTAASDNTFAIPVTLAAGDHSITGRATDTQSKSSGTSVARVITVDQTAPTTIVNLTFADAAGSPGPFRQGTVVTVTAVLAENPTDLAPAVSVNLGSGTYVGGTLPSTVLTSADGTTFTGTLTVPAGNGTVLPSLVATDIAGNPIASSNVRLPNPTSYVGSDGTPLAGLEKTQNSCVGSIDGTARPVITQSGATFTVSGAPTLYTLQAATTASVAFNDGNTEFYLLGGGGFSDSVIVTSQATASITSYFQKDVDGTVFLPNSFDEAFQVISASRYNKNSEVYVE